MAATGSWVGLSYRITPFAISRIPAIFDQVPTCLGFKVLKIAGRRSDALTIFGLWPSPKKTGILRWLNLIKNHLKSKILPVRCPICEASRQHHPNVSLARSPVGWRRQPAHEPGVTNPRGSPLDDSKKQVSSVQNPQRRPFKNCLVHSISGCIPHIFHGFWESPISTNNYGPTLRYQWLLSNQSTAPGAARSRCASFLPKPRCCNQAAHALLQHWSWPISGAAPTMGVETNGHGEVGWKFWQYLCICNVVLAISKHIIQVCLYKYVMCICQYSICWIGMCECRYGV